MFLLANFGEKTFLQLIFLTIFSKVEPWFGHLNKMELYRDSIWKLYIKLQIENQYFYPTIISIFGNIIDFGISLLVGWLVVGVLHPFLTAKVI